MPQTFLDSSAISKSDAVTPSSKENINDTRILTLHKPVHYLESYYYKGALIPDAISQTILSNPRYNKATSFTLEERKKYNLSGLLPPAVETIDTQVRRAYKQLARFTVPMSQYIYLRSLCERNETLFYKLLTDHLEELMPLVYTPTVGQACQEYGLQYRASEGMYISAHMKGNIRNILDNWKANILNEVAIIVLTDGSRILGLGDLGACGIGIPIGKLSLYVAAAGFHPSTTLPMLLDVGTNNAALHKDEFYLGLRQYRLPDDMYYEIVDELMSAIHDKWPHALVQFEDFSNNHCFSLLEKYRDRYLCFNDDIQGTGAVVAAGFLNALRLSKVHPKQSRILFIGAGSASIGVATQILRAVVQVYNDLTEEDCIKMFYMIDSNGIITADRPGKLQDFKIPYARKDIQYAQLEDRTLMGVVKHIKPTALIGLSGQPGQFSEEMLKFMAETNEKPIIFPLSNPTAKAECTYEQAFSASGGRVLFASGSPFPPIEFNGVVHYPSQGNNLYTFPGLGFGSWLSRAKYVTDNMVTQATITLSGCVSSQDLANNKLYPSLKDARSTSAVIAAKVMEAAYKDGVSQLVKQPTDYLQYVRYNQYIPGYVEDV